MAYPKTPNTCPKPPTAGADFGLEDGARTATLGAKFSEAAMADHLTRAELHAGLAQFRCRPES